MQIDAINEYIANLDEPLIVDEHVIEKDAKK